MSVMAVKLIPASFLFCRASEAYNVFTASQRSSVCGVFFGLLTSFKNMRRK